MTQTTDKSGAYPKPYTPDEEIIKIPFWTKLSLLIKTHQNLLFFILLCICLASGLLWWRKYRLNEMTQQASYKLEKATTVEELKGLLQVYGVTPVAPLIRYKLANLYMNDEKYEDARKEYEYIIEKFPHHPLKEQATQILSQLKIDEVWSKGELDKQLTELIQKRNLPRLIVKTTKGDFEIELYEDDAPNTVANFISIVQDGVYSPTLITEIKPNLGVCFNKKEPLDYHISFEENQLKHQEGVIGMLRDIDINSDAENPDKLKYLPSSGSGFYIYRSSSEDENLDGKYTIFGRVVKGMTVVRQLTKGDAINFITISFKRPHEYKVDKIITEKPTAPVTQTLTTPITPTNTTKDNK